MGWMIKNAFSDNADYGREHEPPWVSCCTTCTLLLTCALPSFRLFRSPRSPI